MKMDLPRLFSNVFNNWFLRQLVGLGGGLDHSKSAPPLLRELQSSLMSVVIPIIKLFLCDLSEFSLQQFFSECIDSL